MILRTLKGNALFKVLSLNSFSVGVNFVLGILSIKIISLYLGPPGMAFFGSFKNFTSMIKSITTLGVNNSLIKLFVENRNDKKELSVIYSTFFWVFLILAFLLSFVILFFANDFSDFLFFNSEFANPIRFFGFLLPLIVINAFWIAIYNGLEKFKRIVVVQIISNVLIFGLTAYLIWRKNILGGLYALVLGEFVMVFITFLFVIKDKKYFKFDLQKVINKKYLQVIKKFSLMALVSAFIIPLTLLFIRNAIVKTHSIEDAGIWDATNKISGFYMSVFSSGLSLYYMPKLASLQSDSDFKIELKSYFKLFVPLFFIMLIIIFLFKDVLLNMLFTKDFIQVKEVLIWQLLGDFFRVMTLAFGYQILVKSRIKDYIFIELVFNITYLALSFYLIKNFSFAGALQSYFYASLVTFFLVLFMFRNLFVKS